MATKKVNPEVETEEVNAPETKKVKIKLPVLRGQKDQSVFVGVNDETYQIIRGQEVEVPEYVAEIIRNSERALDEADAYIASVAN